jgi:hypothetical protein
VFDWICHWNKGTLFGRISVLRYCPGHGARKPWPARARINISPNITEKTIPAVIKKVRSQGQKN